MSLRMSDISLQVIQPEQKSISDWSYFIIKPACLSAQYL